VTDPNQYSVADLIQVDIVWDASLGSPPELQGYSGAIVAIPPNYFPLPARGTLFGVRGYSRNNGDGSWSWILQGDVDPVDQFVDSLTGKGRWVNAASRVAVKQMVQQLFSAGISRDTIAASIPAFVQAVASEVFAEQAAGLL
jgi:acylphosphatase